MKIFKDIFVNTRSNFVRLAEIEFDDKIESINYLSDEIDWRDIKSNENKDAYLTSIIKDEEHENNSISGKHLLMIPGAIDPHVHFDTPGFEFREDFEHASTAAAFGGVTTIIDMPCTSIPPVTNLNNFTTKLDAVKSRSLIDFGFWGGIGRAELENLDELKKKISDLSTAGVAGFKVYVISGMSEFADLTYEQIKQVAQIVKQTGKPLAVHAEDKSLVHSRQLEAQNANKNSWKDYCVSRDVKAEVRAVKELIKISAETSCRVHIVHLSSGEGLKLITEAKQKGIPISTETCPQYLQFTQTDFENSSIRNYLKTAPPVKFSADKEALWVGLKNNEIDFVTTDHAGCDPMHEKTSDNFWEVYGGIPGIEHRVPYLFSEGFLRKRITLEQTVNQLSTNAAKFFKLQNKGLLEKGNDADFALIDLWNSQNIFSASMHSKGKYTPFEGMNFNCIVQATYLRGKPIMNRHDNYSDEIGIGKFQKSGNLI